MVSKDEFQVLMDEFTEKTGVVPDVEATYEAADSDGDGLLSEDEMTNALAQGPPPPPPMMGMTEEGSTDSLDTNGDGVVNYLDFIDDSSDQAQLDTKDSVNPMFAELDTDSDGMISKSEFKVFADRISGMTGISIDVDATFESADTDGDGLLSEDDMAEFMPPPPPPMMGMTTDETEISITDEEVSSVMSSLDRNGDGVIEESELKLALLEVKLNAYNYLSGDSDDTDTSLMNLLG